LPPARILLYAATAAVMVLAVRSVFIAPPPLFLAIAAAMAYAGLVLAGVLVLRLRVFCDAVVRGPKSAAGVALTFDDGPDPKTTPRVLDLLDAAGAKGTFFVIGRKAEAHPELVRAIRARGHGVGLHAYAHDRLFALRTARRVRADLAQGVKALEAITGERPVLFRPPIGHTNPTIARVADELDLVVVGWTIGGRDGVAGAEPEAVAARVSAGLRAGAIVLLHDAAEKGGREPAGVRALPSILEAIAEARLAVMPVEGWIDAER
jgi:peptidoglycan/xylan/chitin deacetylase (PgdA/CDA1 family)